jgi:AraC-like DNA-binding protein
LRFREAFGHSILDEIQNVRLEKVCFLLSRTDTPIGAIAGLCGYRTDIALRKLFRSRMGQSLADWRKANRRR